MEVPGRNTAIGLALLLGAGAAGPAGAVVTVTDPDDPAVFFRLFRPTGQLDETGLSGFEYLVSSRTGEFRANDQYLISGEETGEATSIGIDLGAVADLSGVPFAFSIAHNRVGGRNFTFRLAATPASEPAVLCWGVNCEPGSVAVETLNGVGPIHDYNGLQIQVRAQDVAGSSAALSLVSMSGVTLVGADLFDEVVTPDSPGTIPGDTGRRGQWMMADDLDLWENEWELTGTVTLSRPDAATQDVTKVRLAVDLVRDPELPYRVPEPSAGAGCAAAVAALAGVGIRRRARVWRTSDPRSTR